MGARTERYREGRVKAEPGKGSYTGSWAGYMKEEFEKIKMSKADSKLFICGESLCLQ